MPRKCKVQEQVGSRITDKLRELVDLSGLALARTLLAEQAVMGILRASCHMCEALCSLVVCSRVVDLVWSSAVKVL